jgi:hypothetical protein
VTRQYDICENPDRATRGRYPFFIVLQSDLLQPLETIVVAPLAKESARVAIEKLHPVVTMSGVRHRVLMATLAAVPRSRLGKTIANARSQHAEFLAAIDLLFTGI